MIHSFQYLPHGLSRRSSSISDGRCGWNEHALITKCVRASAASGDVSRPFRNVPSEALSGASGVGGRPASVVVQGSGTAARCLRLPDVWPVGSPGDQRDGVSTGRVRGRLSVYRRRFAPGARRWETPRPHRRGARQRRSDAAQVFTERASESCPGGIEDAVARIPQLSDP